MKGFSPKTNGSRRKRDVLHFKNISSCLKRGMEHSVPSVRAGGYLHQAVADRQYSD